MCAYELKSLDLPKLTGTGLKAFAAAVDNPVTRAMLLGGLLENAGIPKLRGTNLSEAPTFYPLVNPVVQPEVKGFEAGERREGFPFRTIGDYARAYREGSFSPEQAAEKFLEAAAASENDTPSLRAFVKSDKADVLAQARAAGERLRSGKALGPLDGVPVAVKDEVDMLPYPTSVGTRFLGKTPAVEDATVVARLRAAGALLVGKTNMHEIGINPNGANANFGAVRNPYDPACDPGGSSSGSAAAVAAGLVPLAVGADGGGSIRIPAGLCGIVGLKATFGRLSEKGAAPLCWSVGHLGPLATSVEDAALGYWLMAGPDPQEPNTLVQPPVTLAGWNCLDLKGVRLGIYRDWFEHGSNEMVRACREMVAHFKEMGAEVCEIEIPWLDEMRIAHALTILSEMAVCMKAYPEHWNEHGAAVRLSLVLGKEFSATDYLQAQRLRTRAMHTFAQVYEKVDVILTPATALAAQPIPKGGEVDGWSDLGTDTEMMRFVYPGNLVGLPAISFPVGYDGRGMPLGMQAMGRHWEEHLLLRVAYNAESVVDRKTPRRYYPLMG